MRTLDSELKATAAEFAKSSTAENKNTKTKEILNKQIQTQTKLIEQLKSGLEKSTQKYGENDTKTLKWKESVNKATAELNRLEKELNSETEELHENKNATEENADAQNKLSTISVALGTAIGQLAVHLGTALVNAAREAASAIVDFSKECVDAYANAEQLRGGVDKIFGASSGNVIRNAENAYKTAGLSANEYMETVTSFSASLIGALGGDTVAAAELADIAIRDMSDNVNTFGGDIESVMNAYKGFSKGTYTMLDNLRIGYGGTKEEMERLLKDAEEISGVKYEIGNFGDMIKAINVVQKKLNITGTTAKEAATTIEGSARAQEAAWENLKTSLADTSGNAEKYASQWADAANTYLDNYLPALQRTAENLPSLLDGFLKIDTGGAVTSIIGSLKTAINGISEWVKNNSDTVAEIGVELFSSLLTLGIDTLPQIGEAIGTIIGEFGNEIANRGPELIELGAQFAAAILEGVAAGFVSIFATEGAREQAERAGISMWDSFVYGVLYGSEENWPIAENISEKWAEIEDFGGKDAAREAGYNAGAGLGEEATAAAMENLDLAGAVSSAITDASIQVEIDGETLTTTIAGFMDEVQNEMMEKAAGFTVVGTAIVDAVVSGITSTAYKIGAAAASAARAGLAAAQSAVSSGNTTVTNNINISGAQNPTATARAVNRALGAVYN